ncbi:MAG TPA: hypothetical protein V6D14_11645 [Coleofasciculaceae cyanobacterium]|jgi:hypothetical protein
MTINSETSKIPGYFVESTAPRNVDEDKGPLTDDLIKISEIPTREGALPNEVKIERIVSKLLESQEPELIISVHGYNNGIDITKKRYQGIHEWINNPDNISHTEGKVFLGYRWPSEDLKKVEWKKAFIALPILPSWTFFIGLVASVILCFAMVILQPNWFLIPLLLLFVVLPTIILTFILMRLSVYFRDSYRAINFGVPDLVELIRQIDQEAFSQAGILEENWKTELDPENSQGQNHRKRIKLTFIGHSLGCLVVTNTIRIISDVFDQKSIGSLKISNDSNIQKLPDEKVGRVFSLGRLVLLAADIPVETVIPRRANFLRSSLRRFEEAYIFSNEGDMVLRIASTIANYISFPASDRINGYRLGNLTVKHFSNEQDTKGSSPKPGIVNLRQKVGSPSYQSDTPTENYFFENPYQWLEIRSSNREHASLEEIRDIAGKPVANLITYFDCTDYVDGEGEPGILSHAKKIPALLMKDYIPLTLDTFLDKKNVHGGYFEGKFSQRVIYQLAFLGFNGFLKTFPITEPTQTQQPDEASLGIEEKVLLEKKLWKFHQTCGEKQIQVVLAPERYSVDILKQKRDRSGY